MKHESIKHGRDSIFKDLVKLHQSLAGEDPAGDPPAAAIEPEPASDPEDVAARFELFVEHLPMGVLFADVVRDRYRHPIEYRVRSVNRRYAELLGMSRVSVLESLFFNVVPGGREDWADALDAVALKGHVTQGISQAPLGNRPMRVVLFLPRRDMLAVVLEDAGADNTALRGSALHTFRQAEQILASVPFLICRFQPGGKLTYANEAYRAFFGGTPESLCAHCYMSVVAEGSRDFVRSRIEMICRDTPTMTYESPLDLASGRRWVQWIDSGVFDEQGKLVEYQSVGQDITGMKEQSLHAQHVDGLLRDLLSFHASRSREHEGQSSVVSKDMRALLDENHAMKQEIKRLGALTIQGELQLCRRCSRINDEEGHWMLPPLYLELHTAATVSNTVCPYCRRKADQESASPQESS
jgi:PAS domain S-box-containing protein